MRLNLQDGFDSKTDHFTKLTPRQQVLLQGAGLHIMGNKRASVPIQSAYVMDESNEDLPRTRLFRYLLSCFSEEQRADRQARYQAISHITFGPEVSPIVANLINGEAFTSNGNDGYKLKSIQGSERDRELLNTHLPMCQGFSQYQREGGVAPFIGIVVDTLFATFPSDTQGGPRAQQDSIKNMGMAYWNPTEAAWKIIKQAYTNQQGENVIKMRQIFLTIAQILEESPTIQVATSGVDFPYPTPPPDRGDLHPMFNRQPLDMIVNQNNKGKYRFPVTMGRQYWLPPLLGYRWFPRPVKGSRHQVTLLIVGANRAQEDIDVWARLDSDAEDRGVHFQDTFLKRTGYDVVDNVLMRRLRPLQIRPSVESNPTGSDPQFEQSI